MENEPSLQSTGLQPVAEASRFNIFYGPNGVRAGWRLFIAVAIFFAFLAGFGAFMRLVSRGVSRHAVTVFSAETILAGELSTFLIYLATSWVMSRIEARRMRDYGLGISGAFAGGFWLAAAAGFVAISVLLFALKLVGVYQLGSVSLHGPEVWKYAALWGVTFLTVGLLEESVARGYALFTLTTGVGFWPAAVLTSIAFGAIHHTNAGESMVGEITAGGIGFFWCILLRKAGTLWPAIGFHAAWDWGETFFYGVPDSGITAPGHLFAAKFAGPAWLTGGTVGPEGSWLCVALVAVLCVAATFIPGRKFPNPEAIPDPRRRHIEPAPTLFAGDSNQLSQGGT